MLNSGDLDQAINVLNEAIRVDPENAHCYTLRASAWVQKRQYDEAITDFSEAIRIDPDWLARIGAAALYSGKSEFDKAIADLDEAIRLDGGDALARRQRGSC